MYFICEFMSEEIVIMIYANVESQKPHTLRKKECVFMLFIRLRFDFPRLKLVIAFSYIIPFRHHYFC